MMDARQAVLFTNRLGENVVEFNSNDRRIKRRITSQEAEALRGLLESRDYIRVDSFCYRIV